MDLPAPSPLTMGGLCNVCPPGMPLYLPVSMLALQTAVPLLIRLSRKQGSQSYHPASVTLVAELLKSALAMSFMLRSSGWGRKSPVDAVQDTAKRFAVALQKLR